MTALFLEPSLVEAQERELIEGTARFRWLDCFSCTPMHRYSTVMSSIGATKNSTDEISKTKSMGCLILHTAVVGSSPSSITPYWMAMGMAQIVATTQMTAMEQTTLPSWDIVWESSG